MANNETAGAAPAQTTDTQQGPQLALTVAEMDLLKAEALIRLNRANEAVPLINKTRVANGQLPPVTEAGPPDEQGCVPRKMNGQCGSLWDALRYEKRLEGMGISGVIAFFDARGWQMLPENSILQLPVPEVKARWDKESAKRPSPAAGGCSRGTARPSAAGSRPASRAAS